MTFPNSEWIGARYKYPGMFREAGQNIQPDIIFWMEIPSGLLISSNLIDPRKPVSFAESFEEIGARKIATLPRPDSIRVPDDRLAKELRRVAGGIPIIVAPVPELDAAFDALTETLGRESKPSYLYGGEIGEDVVAEFFVAAQALFKTAPWGLVAEHQIVGVDISKLKVKGACLSVIGGNDESFGLLLFRSVEDYFAFGTRPAKRRRKDPVAMRSMSFGSRKEIPPSMLREIKAHHWPVAGAKAYPTLFCVDNEMQQVPVTERDFRIMNACAGAFLLFLEQHRDIFEAGPAVGVKASYIDDSGLMVIFTAPY